MKKEYPSERHALICLIVWNSWNFHFLFFNFYFTGILAILPFMDMLALLNDPRILIIILLWLLPWKGYALWLAARRGQLWWFIGLLVLNTLAILEIVYIFFVAPRYAEIDDHVPEDTSQATDKH
jgi:membrane-associated phospholipid phosphatase